MTEILIIRHCEAAGNKEHFFQGQSDCGISERGAMQLEYLAERFRDIRINALYSSPLERAMLTAKAVNRYHGLPIVTDARLMEINGGVWEGRRWADIPTLFPAQSEIWIKTPHLFHPEGGEAMDDVFTRISAAIRDIAAAHEGGRVAVCTHGCAIRCLTCLAAGMPVERLAEVEWCDNCSIMTLSVENGVMNIAHEADASFIPDELSTFARQKWWKNKDGDNFADDE